MDGRGQVALIIRHPRFDGPEGIAEATAYAQQMIAGAEAIAEHAAAQGDPSAADLRAYLAAFRYTVRRLPVGVI